MIDGISYGTIRTTPDITNLNELGDPIVFFRVTHGYLTSILFILVPEKLKNQKLSNTDISNGNYITFMVYSIGLVAGSGAAFGVKYIVTRSI